MQITQYTTSSPTPVGPAPRGKKGWTPTLGSITKALSGAITLNFAESGGPNCSPDCEALRKGVCYAVATEQRKPSTRVSGERKREVGFAACCDAYREEILALIGAGKTIPWIRFSSFGSVPDRELTNQEELAFVRLVRSFPEGAPVHFPVETPQKAERFRGICEAYNLPITVRESAQSDERMNEAADAGEAVSRIVYDGPTKRDRLASAIAMARAKQGWSVCPAVASTILDRPQKIKCGQCTLCAQPGRVILYPQH